MDIFYVRMWYRSHDRSTYKIIDHKFTSHFFIILDEFYFNIRVHTSGSRANISPGVPTSRLCYSWYGRWLAPCKRWRLSAATPEAMAILITLEIPSGIMIAINLPIHGTPFKTADQYVYLRVTLDESLNILMSSFKQIMFRLSKIHH